MNDQSPLVSVIVPFYNAQETLRTCLETVCTQSYKTLEIILIDDGSTDQGAQLAQSLISKEPRIICLSLKENSGPSSARNKGLDHAKGRFVFFMDADDRLPPDALSNLVHFALAHDLEFVSAAHLQDRDLSGQNLKDGGLNKLTIFTEETLMAYVQDYIRLPYIHTAFVHCWGKLYKRDVLEKNKIRFNETLSQLEDVNLNFQFLSHSTKIGYHADPSYIHHIAPESTSLSTHMGNDPLTAQKFDLAFQAVKDFLKSRSHPNPDREVGHLFTSMIIIAILRLCRRFKKTKDLSLYHLFKEWMRSPVVKKQCHFYRPQPGESRGMAFFIQKECHLGVFITALLRVR